MNALLEIAKWCGVGLLCGVIVIVGATTTERLILWAESRSARRKATNE